jgi:hypothetical protein
MQADVFILRLETAARVLKEAASSNNARFVPFTPNSQFTFEDRMARVEAARDRSR